MTRYEAVVFDLYGTLVDFSIQNFQGCLKDMAHFLQSDADVFANSFLARYEEVEFGVIKFRELLRAATGHLDQLPTDAQLDSAALIWEAAVRGSLQPREDSLSVIEAIRELGLKTALITNCAPPTAEVWESTDFKGCFDFTVFSHDVGIKKPDRAIYDLVTNGLQVPAEACLFIGDGSSQELFGASQAGMTPLQLWLSYEDSELTSFLGREEWPHRISSLTDVLRLLDER